MKTETRPTVVHQSNFKCMIDGLPRNCRDTGDRHRFSKWYLRYYILDLTIIWSEV